MSIYIKGMEMPRNEPLLIKLNPDGSVSTTAKNGYRKYAAVPVPEHGRLIDAKYVQDNIIQKWMDKADDSHMYKRGMEDAYEVIRDAPTIIPIETAYCPNCGAKMDGAETTSEIAQNAFDDMMGHPIEKLDELVQTK